MTETLETIHYTADIVVTTPDRRVLLIEREWDPYEGHWALPGGHADSGETSRQAARRELREETGIDVAEADLREVGVFDQPGRDPRGRYVTVAYHVTVPTGTTIVAGDDARVALWWPLDDLPALAFDHADIISAAEARERRPGPHAAGLTPGTRIATTVQLVLERGAANLTLPPGALGTVQAVPGEDSDTDVILDDDPHRLLIGLNLNELVRPRGGTQAV